MNHAFGTETFSKQTRAPGVTKGAAISKERQFCKISYKVCKISYKIYFIRYLINFILYTL